MTKIFKTERLVVRHLKKSDFDAFHEMQGNINVMRYTRGEAMLYKEDQEELKKVIKLYSKKHNDFWIFAIDRKIDRKFIGTVAFISYKKNEFNISDSGKRPLNIKNDNCEIGYRLLEKYWGMGYGNEVVKAMVQYGKGLGFTRMIATVVTKNTASVSILENAGFDFVEEFISDDLKLPERKYILEL